MQKIIVSLLMIFSLLVVLEPAVSLAQSSGGSVGGVDKQLLQELDTAGKQTPLSAKDPRQIVASVIKTLLSILGFIFLILVVYAGFIWMTAMGDEKKVEHAQSVIKMAVFGLAITLLAYAITIFVTGAILRATTP